MNAVKKDYIVVSLSGGKDSTAMLLRLLELGKHIDEIIFCDTYKEFPAMYKHIDKVKAAVESIGIKFTILRNEKSFDYMMLEYRPENPKGFFGKYPNLKGKSWATNQVRWCTKEMKIRVINRYFREMSKRYNVIQYVGIAADETHRIERKSNAAKNKRLPLVEWGWSEADCLEYCYKKGYNWEGLYEIFDRASCWCCPLQSLNSLRKLHSNFPELWEELKSMEAKTWRKFRMDYSVADLEKRFALEEKRKERNLPIKGRDFYYQLKQRLCA